MNPAITLPANHSFTLWTTAAALAVPVKAKAAATAAARIRLPGQSFTLWTQPGKVERIAMKNAPSPAPVSLVPARNDQACCPGGGRWLPAAAGIAVAALLGLLYSSEKGQRKAAEEEKAMLQKQLAAEVSTAKVQVEEANRKAALATSELQAMKGDFTGETARLKTALSTAEDAGKKASSKAAETSAALDRATKALADAKKDWLTRETALQASVASLTEEAGKVKRAAGEEAAKAREALAKLEEAKAAAVKEASAALSDRDALKTEVEKLRKQLESSQPKPAGGPQA